MFSLLEGSISPNKETALANILRVSLHKFFTIIKGEREVPLKAIIISDGKLTGPFDLISKSLHRRHKYGS